MAASTPGASASSTFVASPLPPLDPALCPHHPRSSISVVNADSFAAARAISTREGDRARAKVGVLNLASDEERGGGWAHTLSKTQEEALCYSSTLYMTLDPSYYPWPNLGPGSVAGVFSPGVVVFKDTLDNHCVDLPVEDRFVVSVITVAAPMFPRLTLDDKFAKDEDLRDLRGKIRLVYRMAASNGQEWLVLGAMGCGAYACPPRVVAEEMKNILLEEEFKGWFRQVVFAIYSTQSNGPGNFELFQAVLDGVEL